MDCDNGSRRKLLLCFFFLASTTIPTKVPDKEEVRHGNTDEYDSLQQ
jgi:hypothetical protein